MNKSEQTAPLVKGKNEIFTLLVIALVAVLLVVVFMIGRREVTKKSIGNVTSANSTPTDIAKSVKDKNFDKAKEQVKVAQTDEGKQLLTLASISVSQGDFKGAVDQYKAYEKKFTMTFGVAESMAQTYQALKDNTNAKVYYQKAIVLLQKNSDDFSKNEATRLQAIIKQLN